MKKIQSFLQTLTFTEKSAPIAFFVLCGLSFGLFIPDLGFYMDDWPYIFYANLKGIDGLREMLLYDSRPYAAWLYMTAFRLLGFNPPAWHVFALLMRFATVVSFWAFLRVMWSERKKEAIVVSLLFAVYPFFMLQPFAVGSTHHWFGFLTFNVSLILMVLSMQGKSTLCWLHAATAVVLTAVHLFTSEYFTGLELVRGVILWLLIARSETKPTKRALKVIIYWLPYLVVLGIFFYWRVFIFENPPPMTRNEPVILMQLFSEPLAAIRFLITAFLTDLISVMTIGWEKATDPATIEFASPFGQVKIAASLLGFALASLYFKRLLPDQSNTVHDDWQRGSLTLTIAALATGGLPIWLIGRSIIESKNLLSASRFGIPAMFGAALLTFLLADYFINDRDKKHLFAAILLALAIHFQVENVREFRYSWEKQTRLIHQLVWRAPDIERGTSLLTDEEVLGIMGPYAVSFSVNTAYQVKGFENDPFYWYFPFYYTNPDVDALLRGAPLEYIRLSMHFKGNSSQMLLLDYNPEMNRCLWVLQPQDVNLRLVSSDVRRLAAGSNINLIQPTGVSAPPEEIYGKSNTDTWCYYFQKADLARQFGQWDEIVRLWNDAQAAGYRPDNGFEYIPFIEGLGHSGDWEQVSTLTKFSRRITAGLEPSLCGALDRLAENAPATPEGDEAIKNLKDDLKCINFQ